MIEKTSLMLTSALLLISGISFAEEYKKDDPALTIPECKTIEDACAAVGFIRGEFKVKNGLWANCVGPISKGKDTKPSKMNQTLKASPELTAAAKTCLEKKPKNSKKAAKTEAQK